MPTQEISSKELQKNLVVAGIAFLLLVSATYLSYRHTKSRTPQIVLPGGVTYLGPSSSQKRDGNVATTTPPAASADTIPVPADTEWTTWSGKKYPYSFSYPKTLSLGFFPNDPFDATTIFWGDTNPQENLLLRVENLSADPNNKKYVKGAKLAYVENWWKQYSFSGLSAVEEFTTREGLRGYRALYKEKSDKVPYEHIFLEVPGKSELVVWMSQKLLEKSIFDRIVDSLIWKNL